jgi:hypothetical protein
MILGGVNNQGRDFNAKRWTDRNDQDFPQPPLKLTHLFVILVSFAISSKKGETKILLVT